METTIQNKVTDSGILTIDLSAYIPEEISIFDMKPLLFKELILKEKEFRENLKQMDFSVYKDKFVCITNSSDAIIPMWAYMLVSSYLTPHTDYQFVGTDQEAQKHFTIELIRRIPTKNFENARLIVKGCSDRKAISETAYLAVSQHLLPHVKSLMYGEACSAVPIFKKKSA